MTDYEKRARARGYDIVVGVDEAGRGPLAGPVVACAVSLRENRLNCLIRDSKALSPSQREESFQEIFEKAFVGVGIINETVIDECDILQATFFAMTNAVHQLMSQLSRFPASADNLQDRVYLLIDGNRFKSDLPYQYKTVVRGDATQKSIMCASIAAKVIRDRILMAYDQIFPQYGFRHHKGYATAQHKYALKRFGPSEIHRRSFQTT